ncbi:MULTISPECIES: flavin reductase family protein [unclassified Streptomyces]|uniref:flavin reductase family protein n=1 Tax=unclassified Streptomyces TaxID=2593676 RepID=UPI00119CD4EF|nr:flavin reductase family protein [Streptomyces sp. BK340]TVZ80503.1 flavin reductase (DIM6/NTAB) family NADH-FMN oxidoreductase RutF [Streptomyces sp. BK340]
MDAQLFREFFGSFPTAVSVVTAVDADGEPRGFTCSAITAVSAEPPMLLVCVDKRSQTLRALRSAGAFVVNMLAADGQEAARVFAGRSDRKFTHVRWRPAHVAAGAPVLLDGAYAHAECSVVRTVEAGDHWIFIATVDHCEVSSRPPLLHQRGTFHAWPARAPVDVRS